MRFLGRPLAGTVSKKVQTGFSIFIIPFSLSAFYFCFIEDSTKYFASNPQFDTIWQFSHTCSNLETWGSLVNGFHVNLVSRTPRFEWRYIRFSDKRNFFQHNMVTCHGKWLLYENRHSSTPSLDAYEVPKHVPNPSHFIWNKQQYQIESFQLPAVIIYRFLLPYKTTKN